MAKPLEDKTPVCVPVQPRPSRLKCALAVAFSFGVIGLVVIPTTVLFVQVVLSLEFHYRNPFPGVTNQGFLSTIQFVFQAGGGFGRLAESMMGAALLFGLAGAIVGAVRGDAIILMSKRGSIRIRFTLVTLIMFVSSFGLLFGFVAWISPDPSYAQFIAALGGTCLLLMWSSALLMPPVISWLVRHMLQWLRVLPNDAP